MSQLNWTRGSAIDEIAERCVIQETPLPQRGRATVSVVETLKCSIGNRDHIKSLEMAPFDRQYELLSACHNKYRCAVVELFEVENIYSQAYADTHPAYPRKDGPGWVTLKSALEVTQSHGTIRMLVWCGFLFAFHSNYGRIDAIHECDRHRARHTATAALCRFARLQSRGKNCGRPVFWLTSACESTERGVVSWRCCLSDLTTDLHSSTISTMFCSSCSISSITISIRSADKQ